MIDYWLMFGMFALGAFTWMMMGWAKGRAETDIENEIIDEDSVARMAEKMKDVGIKELEIKDDGFKMVLWKK